VIVGTQTAPTEAQQSPGPLRFLKDTSHRVVKAALHKLAAEIELATPASESWCVNAEDYNERGRVCLELADATPVEVARGMSLLERLVG
jgi:hypothetical protein